MKEEEYRKLEGNEIKENVKKEEVDKEEVEILIKRMKYVEVEEK